MFTSMEQDEGSSPRVWGQAFHLQLVWRRLGIIPTRMGTRKPPYRQIYSLEDHPHAYGDKHYTFLQSVFQDGSSPRVWGQAKGDNFNVGGDGIIPTRMGTSITIRNIDRSTRDHPHAYGDKLY